MLPSVGSLAHTLRQKQKQALVRQLTWLTLRANTWFNKAFTEELTPPEPPPHVWDVSEYTNTVKVHSELWMSAAQTRSFADFTDAFR